MQKDMRNPKISPVKLSMTPSSQALQVKKLPEDAVKQLPQNTLNRETRSCCRLSHEPKVEQVNNILSNLIRQHMGHYPAKRAVIL